MSTSPYKKYKETSVLSASKEKVLLMLYEAAIKFVKKSALACEKGDRAERGINIGKAFDIIIELNTSLNHEINPELTKNLEQLYMFITDQLTQANITGNVKHLNNALRILETLYSGWQQAVEKMKKEGKLSQPA